MTEPFNFAIPGSCLSVAATIHDPLAIALLQQLQRRPIEMLPSAPIMTAFVHHCPDNPSIVPAGAAPLVLLHGFDSSGLEFRRLLPWLVRDRAVWVVDLLGFGFTESPPEIPVSPRTIRQHLHQVLQSWVGQPVVLVGASLGGAVAIDFALNYPEWVRSLVLIDSVGFSGSFPIGQFLAAPLIDWGVEWLRFRKQLALNAAILSGADPLLTDAIRCSLLHQEMPGWRSTIASFTRSGGYGFLTDRISRVSQPTRILWGDADDVLGTADATKFQRSISGSTLRWIRKAGHVPHFDQPEAVAEQILEFSV